MKIQIAKLKYLKISPRKVRLVANLIKGLPVNEAEAQLLMLPHRANQPILKLLRSAVANAKHNQQINPDRLWIKNIRVDQGPRLKRWRTRARGASSLIEKKSSHVTLFLEESEKEILPRFKFIPKPKKIKKEKPKKEKIKKEMVERPRIRKEEKPPKAGVWKRIFKRKAI